MVAGFDGRLVEFCEELALEGHHDLEDAPLHLEGLDAVENNLFELLVL